MSGVLDARIEHPETVRRRVVETPSFAAFVRRIVRAYGRRLADADEVDLAEAWRLRELLDQQIDAAIPALRERYSWQAIGDAVGMSKQAAHERWRHLEG